MYSVYYEAYKLSKISLKETQENFIGLLQTDGKLKVLTGAGLLAQEFWVDLKGRGNLNLDQYALSKNFAKENLVVFQIMVFLPRVL